jgi:quercetin dioxygenase-like cupin family protein
MILHGDVDPLARYTRPGLPPEEATMFHKADTLGYEEILDGVKRKTLVHGDNTLLTEFRLRKGASIPLHRHPHEQTGYLVAGRLQLTIGGEIWPAEAGDSWCIPGDVEHAVQVLEDATAVEVFSPVREDYLS